MTPDPPHPISLRSITLSPAGRGQIGVLLTQTRLGANAGATLADAGIEQVGQ